MYEYSLVLVWQGVENDTPSLKLVLTRAVDLLVRRVQSSPVQHANPEMMERSLLLFFMSRMDIFYQNDYNLLYTD